MLTFFTIPKPFVGHIGIIQRNAIRNWKSLHPELEVILLGNELGVAKEAISLGCLHQPEIELSNYGTPRIDAAFRLADSLARHPVLAYANCDILFFKSVLDFRKSIARRFRRFLLTGHKWMCSVEAELVGDDLSADSVLLPYSKQAVMAGATGIDFFIYPKGQFGAMPPLIVGRPGWDNWMLYHTLSRGIPLIIPEKSILAIHQDHHTEHVPNKQPGTRWEGPEAEFNRRSIGSAKRLEFSLDDANYLISKEDQIVSRTGDYRSNRRKLKALYPLTHWLRG